MTYSEKKRQNRYVNDLRRYRYGQSLFFGLRRIIVPLGLSVVFLAVVGIAVAGYQSTVSEDWLIVAVAAVVGGYMALNIGAKDVANAVGPLAAIVSTVQQQSAIAAQVTIPLWVMAVGAFGIALGLGLFGPKLIAVVGEKITRLNSPRAYCVALSAAVTVLIATTLGLPVSSAHIAVGAVFGVGFLREFLENPSKRKLRPGHKLNATAEDAFNSRGFRSVRLLVRRRFVFSIASAWVITMPASALLAAVIYSGLQLL
ncbi:MAG: hypothetical protein Kow00114_04820 [Kiloniellaceae bacterium]